MRVIADFHIHSKYAMATSKFMGVEYIAKWAIIKGVNLIGTGDCTHPIWAKELRGKLVPAERGLYRIKNNELGIMNNGGRSLDYALPVATANQGGLTQEDSAPPIIVNGERDDKRNNRHSGREGLPEPESIGEPGSRTPPGIFEVKPGMTIRDAGMTEERLPRAEALAMTTNLTDVTKLRFMITGEVACIYHQGGRNRRVHVHFWVPSFEILDKINLKLAKVGKIYSDGRPVLGMSVIEFCRILFSVSDDCVVVPAHIWTPWFGALGSKSGFDSIEECFGEFAQRIFALETGLSSDLPMNWRLSALDKYALISNSDAHSGMNLMREANVFEMEKLNYFEIVNALKSKDRNKFLYTIEYYPEGGMYHFDGHREHEISMAPEESMKLGNICPVCNRELTIGVEHRICDLGDRERGFVPVGAIASKKMVSLDEILMQVFEVKSFSRKAEKLYFELVEKFGSEFNVLVDTSKEELAGVGGEKLSEAIMNVRDGKVKIQPGYDGQYGEITIL